MSLVSRQALSYDLALETQACDMLSRWLRGIIRHALRVCSAMSVFEPKPSLLFMGDDWRFVDRYLSQHLQTNLIHSKVPDDVQLVLIHLQSAYLAQQDVSDYERRNRAEALLSQLNAWEALLVKYKPASSEYGYSAASIQSLLIFTNSLRICLWSMIHPDLCSGDIHVRDMISRIVSHVRALASLRSERIHWDQVYPQAGVRIDRNVTVVWALFVVVCAAHEIVDFEVYVEMFTLFRSTIDKGMAMKFDGVVSIIRRLKQNNASCVADGGLRCFQRHDGLDFLRYAKFSSV